jgi:hypothetical protein
VLAGLVAGAVSGLTLTGVAAVANELPPGIQRVVAHFSEQYLPFQVPRPAGDPLAPGSTTPGDESGSTTSGRGAAGSDKDARPQPKQAHAVSPGSAGGRPTHGHGSPSDLPASPGGSLSAGSGTAPQGNAAGQGDGTGQGGGSDSATPTGNGNGDATTGGTGTHGGGGTSTTPGQTREPHGKASGQVNGQVNGQVSGQVHGHANGEASGTGDAKAGDAKAGDQRNANGTGQATTTVRGSADVTGGDAATG